MVLVHSTTFFHQLYKTDTCENQRCGSNCSTGHDNSHIRVVGHSLDKFAMHLSMMTCTTELLSTVVVHFIAVTLCVFWAEGSESVS